MKVKDEYYWIPFGEKKPRKHGSGIPIPKYLGEMLLFFKEHIRPILKPKQGKSPNLSMWVNKNGKCIGGKTFADFLKDFINKWDNTKFLTPIDFRRILPTLSTDEEELVEGWDEGTFNNHYAKLINTSKEV
jgi:hypothetical protein